MVVYVVNQYLVCVVELVVVYIVMVVEIHNQYHLSPYFQSFYVVVHIVKLLVGYGL